MIIIYGSTTYDFLAVAEGLKAQGLRQHKDYKIVNQLCYRMVNTSATQIYTNNPMIRQDYENSGIEVSDAVE